MVKPALASQLGHGCTFELWRPLQDDLVAAVREAAIIHPEPERSERLADSSGWLALGPARAFLSGGGASTMIDNYNRELINLGSLCSLASDERQFCVP